MGVCGVELDLMLFDAMRCDALPVDRIRIGKWVVACWEILIVVRFNTFGSLSFGLHRVT
jgi:hypothetical protein